METKPRSASNPAPMVGKLTGHWEETFFLPAGSSSSLLYLKDTLSSRKFLVDSEASVSVFPAPASSSSSVTANGSTMTCSGSRIIPLRFRSKCFQWTFQIAPVSIPILGADFLHHHPLLINVAGGHSCEPSDPLPPGEALPRASTPTLQEFPLQANLLSTPQAIKDLLHEFSNVVYSEGQAAAKPRQDVRHHILTNPGHLSLPNPPSGPREISLRPRRVLCHGESQYFPQLQFTLEFPFAHG